MTEVRIGRTYQRPSGMVGVAQFSEDGRYRYWLARWWNVHQSPLITIATNPSGAGADLDDSTIRILERLAARKHCGGLEMLNAYDLVSTDMAPVAADWSGALSEHNDDWISTTLRDWPNAPLLAAWGVIPRGRHDQLIRLLLASGERPIWCLGRTAGGFPRHPLRTQTQEWYPFSLGSDTRA